jgi:hypothetical protein
MTCKTCRHGADIGDYVVCRRLPPQVDPSPHVVTEGDRRLGVWPMVGAEESCGEYLRDTRKLPDRIPFDF